VPARSDDSEQRERSLTGPDVGGESGGRSLTRAPGRLGASLAGDLPAPAPITPAEVRELQRAAEWSARAAWWRAQGRTGGRSYGDAIEADPIERPERASAPPLLETFRSSFPGKDQLGTSFTPIALETVDDDGGTIRPEVFAEILADDRPVHYYRRQVAAYLEPWWPRRAAALVSCGEAGARCDCADCGARHVLPYRCGARSCPTCARTAAAIVSEKVARKAERAAAELLQAWDGPGPRRKRGWKMLTLSTRAKRTAAERYEPATLREYVKAVRSSWGKFWRSTVWGSRRRGISKAGKATKRARRDTCYAIGIEVAPGGMVHLHAAIFGEYIDNVTLAALWRGACELGGFIEIHSMYGSDGAPLQPAGDPEGFRDALREVLKYVSKGDKEPGQRPQRAAAVEYALRSIRRVEVGGALRFVAGITEKEIATAQRECESCQAAPSGWRWRGMRSPTYVRRNQGFGISHIADDVDAEQLRATNRAAHMGAQAVARELARIREREHRPGGRFFGGSPPPWIDDPDEWETVAQPRPGPS
jgi:hypothetical protein